MPARSHAHMNLSLVSARWMDSARICHRIHLPAVFASRIDWSSFTSITVSLCGQIVHLRLLAERPSPQRIFSRYYCDYCDTHLTHDSVSKTCPVTNARSLFFLSRHLSRRTAQFSRLLACICVCLQPRRIAPNRHCWHILLSSLDWFYLNHFGVFSFLFFFP